MNLKNELARLQKTAKWRKSAIEYQVEIIHNKNEYIRKLEKQVSFLEALNQRVAYRISPWKAFQFFINVILYKLKLKR